MSKKILVTGGAGYIGSHVCKAIAALGYTPIVYDNLSCGHRWAVQWGPLEVGDIADRSRLDLVLRRHSPSAVMHFAASACIEESVVNPGKYYRNNVSGTLTLLEAMRDLGIKKLVFSSSCATYGIPEAIPISEHHPQCPINPYGASKLMSEKLLQDFDCAHSIKSISLRYFNASGADPDGQLGEAHDPETHLIPLVLDVAAGRIPHLTINGITHDTPDGTCIRDYIHVSDLASAHILALGALEVGGPTTAYNLGNGKGFSVKEIVSAAESVTGRVVPYRIGTARIGDPPCLVGDARRIKKELGWSPRFSELESMITSAWRWRQTRL